MQRLIVGAVSGAMLAGVGTAPRAQSNQPPFVSPPSELVVLPVTVTDTRGRFVSDLPRERFAVYDNGRRQEIGVFSHEDTTVTIGLIVDTSGSMRGKLGDVIAAALAFARSSQPEDELFTIAFNDRIRDPLPGRFLSAADVGTLDRTLSSFVPDGETSLYDALVAGLDRLDTGTRPRRVLVLISDGGDNASSATRDQVLTRARRSNATVYTIGLMDPQDPDADPGLLKKLAQATGGVRFLPASSGLMEVCQHIAQEIRSGYTLGYVPPDRDGAYHQVRVQVSAIGKERLNVRTRSGYFAASRPTPREHDDR